MISLGFLKQVNEFAPHLPGRKYSAT